ncbi:hypothetical protein ACJX0J_031110, partial [Zea mays]
FGVYLNLLLLFLKMKTHFPKKGDKMRDFWIFLGALNLYAISLEEVGIPGLLETNKRLNKEKNKSGGKSDAGMDRFCHEKSPPGHHYSKMAFLVLDDAHFILDSFPGDCIFITFQQYYTTTFKSYLEKTFPVSMDGLLLSLFLFMFSIPNL